MESLSSPSDVRNLFLRNGWTREGETVEVSQMTGGVSCHTWKILSGNSRWVLKQPLAQLETEVDWFSDVKRIDREADALRVLASILDPGSVPDLQFVDSKTHSIVMTCAPDEAENWKTQMMAGRFEQKTASTAGSVLSTVHERSQRLSSAEKSKFESIQFFIELRIEPFHKYLTKKYPEIQKSISILIIALEHRRTCITHGDYSPKNMLVTPDKSIILLDFEVAHWGNPVFDVAYCLGHLMLKGWAFDRRQDAQLMINAFLDAYKSETDLLLPHLGLMLLARLDGTSTVDYVVQEELRTRIRTVAMSWIKQACADDRRERPKFSEPEISRALTG